MNIKTISLLIMLLLLPACSTKNKVVQAYSTQEFVTQNLGKAVENAHSELATLANLRGQGIQPLIPPPDPNLSFPIKISWTGSAEGILKELCLQVGYRFNKVGELGMDLPVVVYAENVPAYQLMEEIARQVEPQAYVKVDTISSIITLIVPSNKGK